MPTSVRKQLEGFAKISETLVWSSNPETISQKTMAALTDVFECDCAFIHLLDVSGDYLVRYVTCGEFPSLLKSDSRVSITTGRALYMIKTRQPIIMDFLHPDPADRLPEIGMFKSAASVPLLAGDDILGMFSILFNCHLEWTKNDIDYLIKIGRLLGTTVRNAQIARKTVDLEILLERKRLSGELHDNLSQLVGSLNMNVEAALLSWEEDDREHLQRDLNRIRHTSQEAARMLREEMLSLRTPTNETKGLIPGIKESIQRFSQQWGIDTELQLGEDMETLIVSTQLELQFIRILHESFSNILRHATASHVRVILQRDSNRLQMQIQDDGSGFDPETISRERLGLRIMRERAESLGGELTVESGKGTGTMIRVDVPLYR